MDRFVFQTLAEKFELGHVAQEIFNAAKNCVRLTKSPADDQSLPIGASKIGGSPDVPRNFEWPYWHNSFLAFLIQINLHDLQAKLRIDALPASGVLSFFFRA